MTDRSRRVTGTFVGLWLLTTAAMGYLIAPASVLPVAMADLAIGPTAAGWLVSVVFGVQVLASTPAGIGLDRTNARRVIAVAAFVLVAAAGWGWLAATSGSFASLLVSRALGGLGIVVGWNAAATVIGRVSVDARRATLLGGFTASAPAGYALAHLTAPAVASRFGWAAIFLAYVPLLLGGLAVFWLASRPLDLSARASVRPERGDVRRVLLDRRVWHVAAMGFAAYSLYVFVNSWLPTYLVERLGFSLTEGGLALAVFPAVGILSRSGGGLLADRAFGGRRRPVLVLSFVLAAPALAVIALADSAAPVLVALVVAGLTIQLGMGVFYATVGDLVDRNVAATAIAFLTSVGVLGSFSAPLVGGLLIERTGSFLPAFGYAALVLAGGTLLAWRAPEAGRAG